GITRQVVLDLCRRHGQPHAVRDISLTEVYRAGEAFCTGTMGEIVPIVKVDGRSIGGPAPGATAGPITAQIQAWFAALVRTEGVEVC
ncbi:MAG: aminotransferase class IV, partial [Pirellulales bacterium]